MLTKRLTALLLCLLLLIPLAACQQEGPSGNSSETWPDELTCPLPDAPWGTAYADVEQAAKKAKAEVGTGSGENYKQLTVPNSLYLPKDSFCGLAYADVNAFTIDLRFYDDKLKETGIYVEAKTNEDLLARLTEVYGEPAEVWEEKNQGPFPPYQLAAFNGNGTKLEVFRISENADKTMNVYRLWFSAAA